MLTDRRGRPLQHWKWDAKSVVKVPQGSTVEVSTRLWRKEPEQASRIASHLTTNTHTHTQSVAKCNKYSCLSYKSTLFSVAYSIYLIQWDLFFFLWFIRVVVVATSTISKPLHLCHLHSLFTIFTCVSALCEVCGKPWRKYNLQRKLLYFFFLEHKNTAISQNGLMGSCTEIDLKKKTTTKKRSQTADLNLIICFWNVCL